MPSRYTITEPHPTVAQNTYTHAGRGGAGNHFRAPPTTSPAGVPTPLHPVTTSSSTASSSSSSGRFYSGRGGAGNASSPSDARQPFLSFEDEFSRADRRDTTLRAGYHVGRGGAGNFAAGSGLFGGSGSSSPASAKKGRQGSASSSESGDSLGSGVLRRLGAIFKH